MEKPTIPKGTRDFGPATMAKRQFILENIKKVFQKYGFQPLETPAMENLSTLTGKYGEEGDQLLFRVLDSGQFYEKLISKVNEAETRHRFMRGLLVILKNLCDLIFTELEEKDTRHSGKIQNLIESEKFERLFIGIDLEDSDRYLLKNFIQTESVITSINLAYLFIDSPIYKENYKDVINHHFSQFTDNVIIKGYSKILENFLITNLGSKEVASNISEKGLRYDLTVPFARYVVMNRGEITFPFKRYQIQPVWRADRPQKGRYREFYQCDADVVGTDSLICEAEIVLMIKEVFKALGIGHYSIKINHRAILSGLAELCGAKENETSLFIAIDKLDKIGEEKVREELKSRGFEQNSLNTVFEILNFKGTTQQKIDFLTSKFSSSANGQKGIANFKEVLSLLNSFGDGEDHVEFDIALARGLSYYTGCIFEVKINNVSIGSVSGGGRYDNLTGNFGLPGVSGVGISFGVDRLYDAMEELKLFPKEAQISSTVMVAHLDEETMRYGLKVAHELRQNGIATEIYPDQSKLKKQLDYANKKMIPFVIVIGPDEMNNGMLTIKNMEKGEQEKLLIDDIIGKLFVKS